MAGDFNGERKKDDVAMPENTFSHAVIGAAIEVHQCLGPRLLEGVSERALCHELVLRRIPFVRQQKVPLHYKGVHLEADLRFDLLVAGQILLEIKAKETLSATDKPQLLTYLRMLNLRLGLLINFHAPYLKNGIHRIVNRLPEKPPTEWPPER